MSDQTFSTFLKSGISAGGFQTDDALAAILPLMKEVAEIHESHRVAPLRGLSHIRVLEGRILALAASGGISPQHQDEKVRRLMMPASTGLEIIGESRRDSDTETHRITVSNLDVARAGEDITRPVFVPGHVSWEHAIGHHDELTDIFSIGMLLCSLLCGLDFGDPGELENFASHRKNLFALAPRLHPVAAAVAVEMTELHRGKRSQDLLSVIRTLENYRDQPFDEDLNQLPGLEAESEGGRRKIIQTHLRDRLFDISRRNRLLYFKSSQATLNLTTSSVPLVLEYRNIRPEQLLYWHHSFASEILSGRSIALGKWLRTEEAPYLPGQLDKLISDARRSRAEYGFSQLRLVIAFLRWNNLKEYPQERIHSPLLLLPVELGKRRGVKDQYILEPQGTEAEVNPALRHHLKQLYDLDLPATVDLKETTLADFHATFRTLIHATEPGVNLELSEKPKIQLIHDKARQRMDQYRRRMARQGKSVQRAAAINHSYDPGDFRPLGLETFRKRILPSPLPMREIAGAPPAPRTPFIVAPAAPVETERKLFSLIEESEGNPYSWEMDLCAVTLANFNYRKMSLVRDYANLIEQNTPHAAFDRVFSIEPRTVEETLPPSLPPAEQHLIISADATQIGAIAKARQGESLIIQGPPGTGKSQTITNLIADYAARGKRVLFVCEKRAAIDVVFHRLRQQGLDELCCLIHDSQADKKEFILNLKQTYESWLSHDDHAIADESGRKGALATIEAELAALENHVSQMTATREPAGIPLRDLILRLIELRGSPDGTACPKLTAPEQERLPHYADWLRHGEVVARLETELADLGAPPVFATHPLRWLSEEAILSEGPLENLAERFDEAERMLDDLIDALAETTLPTEDWNTLDEVAAVLSFSEKLLPLANHRLLDLLDPASARAAAFQALLKEHDIKAGELREALAKTLHWKDKLNTEDTAAALAITPKLTGIFRFLNPDWWRLRKVMAGRYDFSKHAVAPSWERLLLDLSTEHSIISELERIQERSRQEFAGYDLSLLQKEVLATVADGSSPSANALRKKLPGSASGDPFIASLASLAKDFSVLRSNITGLVFNAQSRSLPELATIVRDLREEYDTLPELLPVLRDLTTAPESLRRSVREFPLTSKEMEAACAVKTLDECYRKDRMLQRFDSHVLRQKLDRLAAAHHQWLERNAGWIRGEVRRKFVENVKTSSQPASVLSPDQKQFKKSYTTGRRELEHEFGKTMRYKSIRDLAAGDPGSVVRDLKPIWLMSPLSVSDTLPLDAGLFDVVIFDEASQIPVEDAVPAAYRAGQVIVVGDEMQLPPTSFFSSGRDADEEITVEEEGETVSVMMDADSFLTQCARNLPSTLLAWHYRSRYESLISFSNAAFYGGELYTIPDRQISPARQEELCLENSDAADELTDGLLARPVSFIRCGQGIYRDRRNPTEAQTVAVLVRSLLRRKTKMSIGVAAFSEAQQAEIESALETLASQDAEFATELEAEYVREEDDQFCGLFVKNLENVQGDERDIILMSVCYAPDQEGKMRMNFGPINQRGGEKRLNVIFSRARHHMAIISSIRHAQITNDYNDGARALKNFLLYAESLSAGESGRARQLLEGMNPLRRKSLSSSGESGPVTAQIAEALAARGWSVETNTGQSRFRCDVSVRAAGADRHQLAILVESGGTQGILERFQTRPGILRAFGWQVLIVTPKDWWHEPHAILENILRLLRRETTDLTEPEEPSPAEATPAETVALPETTHVPAPIADEPVPSAVRRFEFKDGGSMKFWEILQDGPSLSIRFGRIGTNGQSRVKTFEDDTRAGRELQKLINEKTGKGYIESL